MDSTDLHFKPRNQLVFRIRAETGALRLGRRHRRYRRLCFSRRPDVQRNAQRDRVDRSGNVFADLGLTDADELYTRAQIGYCVHKILLAKGIEQREIAAVLGITQSDVSHLMNGHFSRFTTDKLLTFLKCLDRKVIVRIAPRKAGDPYQQVSLAR